MCVEKVDDLITGDAHVYGAADGFTGHLSRDHIWVACAEASEEREDGDLERRRGVCVKPVIGFNDDEAFVIGGRGTKSAAKTSGCTA